MSLGLPSRAQVRLQLLSFNHISRPSPPKNSRSASSIRPSRTSQHERDLSGRSQCVGYPSLFHVHLVPPRVASLTSPSFLPLSALTDLLASSHVSSRLTAGSAATTNLFSQIDRDKVWGLNIDTPSAAASSSRTGLEGEGRGRGKGEAKEVIKEWAERGDVSVWVESQEDPDLILTVPFVQNVRVRSLLLKTAAGEEAPAVVRLWGKFHPSLLPDSIAILADKAFVLTRWLGACSKSGRWCVATLILSFHSPSLTDIRTFRIKASRSPKLNQTASSRHKRSLSIRA